MSAMDQPKEDMSLEERRARLERRAEVIRSRLLRHVDALDARRHQVTEVGRQAKEMAPKALGIVLASGALLGTGIGLVSWAFRARKKHLLSYRIAQAIEPFRREPRPSVLGEVGRKLLVSVVTVVAGELAKRFARGAFDGRLLSGALAVPHDEVHVHHDNVIGADGSMAQVYSSGVGG